VTEVVAELEISRGTYYQWEEKALRAVLAALSPGRKRPPRRAGPERIALCPARGGRARHLPPRRQRRQHRPQRLLLPLVIRPARDLELPPPPPSPALSRDHAQHREAPAPRDLVEVRLFEQPLRRRRARRARSWPAWSASRFASSVANGLPPLADESSAVSRFHLQRRPPPSAQWQIRVAESPHQIEGRLAAALWPAAWRCPPRSFPLRRAPAAPTGRIRSAGTKPSSPWCGSGNCTASTKSEHSRRQIRRNPKRPPREEFVPKLFPEALHLAQRLRCLRSTLDVRMPCDAARARSPSPRARVYCRPLSVRSPPASHRRDPRSRPPSPWPR